MNFKIGQKWSARGGMIVTIVAVHSDNREYPIIGTFGASADLQEFTCTGRFLSEELCGAGDLVELVTDAQDYVSPNVYSLSDYFRFLERQYLIFGAIIIPPEVRYKTRTLSQAVAYLLDQENDGYSR